MASSEKRDRGALIALGMALAAIVAAAWLSQPIDQIPPAVQSADVEQYKNQDVGKLVAAIRDFNPWEDTFAQWIMALFGVVATLASLRAIYLLRDTLDANRKAAVAANRSNDIMRAELRPWLTLRRKIKCKFTVIEIDPETSKGKKFKFNVALVWRYDVENVGKSPAFGMRTKEKIICSDSLFEARGIFREYVESVDSSWETKSQDTIFHGEKARMRQSEWYSAVDYVGGNSPQFFLMFVISYRSQENDIIGLEARLLGIDFNIATQGPWQAELLEFSGDRITR